ncbi:MAG: C-GCAxxG-C-C family protein [Methanoregula sp.]|jgi:C_GCAxxG_C_C family probable redox protein
MTLTRAGKAAACFAEGYSCSQAVCAAFAEDFGIDRDTALKLSCGFGGGVSHTGNTCGAVSGAILVIGMKYGRTGHDCPEAKARTYAKVNEFITEFLRRNHSTCCTTLLDCNLSDPKELARARETGIMKARCPGFVQDAVEILEKIV